MGLSVKVLNMQLLVHIYLIDSNDIRGGGEVTLDYFSLVFRQRKMILLVADYQDYLLEPNEA